MKTEFEIRSGAFNINVFLKKPGRGQNHFNFYTGCSVVGDTFIKRDLERFAVNILKALKSKKLNQGI